MATEQEVSETAVYYGSDNIFADLDLPNPEELLAKTKLIFAMQDAMKTRKLTAGKAAKILGLEKAQLMEILCGHFDEYSTEQLLAMAVQLGLDVEIVIQNRSKPSKTAGKVSVAFT